MADFTTLRVGGLAGRILLAETSARLIELATRDQESLVIAGGSNVVVSDAGYSGDVILIRTSGLIQQPTSDPSKLRVKVASGVDWGHLVETTVARSLSGLELLAGIPGSVGATPIQNVGAYGAQVSDVLVDSEVLNRKTGEIERWSAADWQFGYRTSGLRSSPQSHVVLSVTFELAKSEQSAPLHYPSLIEHLGVSPGAQVGLERVCEGVLAVRRARGMVLEPRDHDTWSVGSFFVNPVLSQAQAADLPALAPKWPAATPPAPSGIKTSAAWLIEHAGFHGGYSFGNAALSNKHVLAITNRGGATCDEIVTLASLVRDRVRERTGVELTPEPRLINCHLPPHLD